MKGKVSIIIPVYNASQYIDQCVASVADQSYTEWELLLVDDGSTDDSLAKCREWAAKDRRIVALPQRNAGPSAARNTGLNNASGEYVVFVDADDSIAPNCIEEAIMAIANSDIAYWGTTQLYPDGSTKTFTRPDTLATNRLDTEKAILSLKKNQENYPYYGFTWNKIFRRDIIEEHKVRFVEGLACYEDDIFTTAYMAGVNSLSIIGKPLYNYRILSTSLTTRRHPSQTFQRLHSLVAQSISQYSYAPLLNFEHGRAAGLLVEAARQATSLTEAMRLLTEARHYAAAHSPIDIPGRRDGLLLSLPSPLSKAFYLLDRLRSRTAKPKR